jgi:hypothetical protein
MIRKKNISFDKKYIKNYRKIHSMSEREIKNRIIKQKIQISINSFGGVYSNFLYDILNDSGLNINSSAYHSKNCHYIRPIKIKSNLKCILFLYNEDIRMALSSQLNRALYLNYYKLFPSKDCFNHADSNNIKIKNILPKLQGNHNFPLIEDWLKLIYIQIECWTDYNNTDKNNSNKNGYDIIIINMNKLDEYKNDLFKYILHNICSINGILNQNQRLIMMRLYNSIILQKQLIRKNKRKTKKYHNRFKDEQLSEIEKELVEKIDKKLIELPDFKIIKNIT